MGNNFFETSFDYITNQQERSKSNYNIHILVRMNTTSAIKLLGIPIAADGFIVWRNWNGRMMRNPNEIGHDYPDSRAHWMCKSRKLRDTKTCINEEEGDFTDYEKIMLGEDEKTRKLYLHVTTIGGQVKINESETLKEDDGIFIIDIKPREEVLIESTREKNTEFVLSLGIFFNSIDAACKNYDRIKNCPIETPCCNKGWCSNDPRSCATDCEPENSYSVKSCYPKAYCVNFYETFNNTKIVNAKNFTGDPLKYDWTSEFEPDYASIEDGKLLLSMKYDGVNMNSIGNYQGFGSTVSTTRWMEYGWVTARVKSGSSSLGVVSSFITRNLEINEIDFEWVGLATGEVQSNYYWEGVIDYTHQKKHKFSKDASKEYYDYTIEWLPDHITWFIDGTPIRTVKKDSTKVNNGTFQYPIGPQRIQFSIWDGGMTVRETSEWAGSPTNWSNKNHVYKMYVDWVNITCYYKGNSTIVWPPAGYGPLNNFLDNNVTIPISTSQPSIQISLITLILASTIIMMIL
ncbi:hypothetical protein G9A89_016878 [Geosiphon pyriformis]|nr:hypothetical protein G9A89_016878 [Geosiphon pyriformis]